MKVIDAAWVLQFRLTVSVLWWGTGHQEFVSRLHTALCCSELLQFQMIETMFRRVLAHLCILSWKSVENRADFCILKQATEKKQTVCSLEISGLGF